MIKGVRTGENEEMLSSGLLLLLLLLLPLLALTLPSPAKSKEDEETRKNGDLSYMREKLVVIGKRTAEQLKEQEAKRTPAVRTFIDNVIKKEKEKEKVHATVLKTGDDVARVNEIAGVSSSFYGGDIILTRDQMDLIISAGEEKGEEGRERRQAYRDSNYPNTIWNTGFYYYFDSTTKGTHVETVTRRAIKHWSDNTCINFYESSTASHKVRITRNTGCWSYVGRTSYATQNLSLGDGCDHVGIAMHEIGHALGFFHEQARHDRDYYVHIQSQNIQSGATSQFDKQTTATNYNYDRVYDYGSVMQYKGAAFSSNGSPTMVAADSQQQETLGSYILSFRDIVEMNDHYGCRSLCNGHSTKCYYDGFAHPRNCSSCLCPLGFGGSDCSQRPAGCGQTFSATTSGGSFSGTVGDTSTTIYDDFAYCIYWIYAPAGMRVKATLSILKTTHCVGGCTYGGIEFKQQPSLTGPRFCCDTDVNKVIYSNSNVMPIIVYHRYHYLQFGVTYVAF